MLEAILSSLNANPYFSAGFGLLGVGTGLALLRQGAGKMAIVARRRLLVTLEIPSKDPSYLWFLQWMGSPKAPSQSTPFLSVETSYIKHDNGSSSTIFSLIPGPGRHYFKWKNAWFKVERERDGKLMDLTSGSPFETVTLTTLSRDRHLIPRLLEEAKKLAVAKQEGKTVLYTSYGPEWRPFGLPRRKRSVRSVVLDQGIAEILIKDVCDFISNGNWYTERGIPYRRGYLLYGPPGSGKSSFIQALAGELDYNICILNLSERGLTDDRLNHLLAVAPPRTIMLLEDVDAAFSRYREQNVDQGYQSMVTFSGLLNALDGVASAEERIIFMTTNHYERLDPALIRPGRVDVKMYLGEASEHQIRQLFLRFYSDRADLVEEFVQKVKGKEISMAQLQGHFVFYKNDPEKALRNANEMNHENFTTFAQESSVIKST